MIEACIVIILVLLLVLVFVQNHEIARLEHMLENNSKPQKPNKPTNYWKSGQQ